MRNLLLFVLGLLLATATSVHAKPPQVKDSGQQFSRFVRDVHRPYTETTVVGTKGQQIQMFDTRGKWASIVKYYKNAYAHDLTLNRSVTCEGYIVFSRKRIASITLYRGANRVMMEIHETRDGSRIKLFGVSHRSRKVYNKRPFHRVVPLRSPRPYGI